MLSRPIAAALLVLAGLSLTLGFGGDRSQASGLRVVATDLNNPRKIFVGPGGAVYVAEAGAGGRDRCFTSGGSKTCVGLSGSVTMVANGVQTRIVTGLPSAASTDGRRAEGPAAVIVAGGRYAILLGEGRVDASDVRKLGPDGAIAGDLISTPAGNVSPSVLANLGAFEARHNPDHGAGPGAAAGPRPLDSNPYAMTRYKGGYAIADAAGNDLLWLSPAGRLTTLAVFPTQKVATRTVQSVPSSVAVGPDGALYVGELTGFPFRVGKARVWRVVPGHKPTLYASGFTNISDLAWQGKDLLVLEIAAKGLLDSRSPGALIRVTPGGTRTVLASAGLVSPTGLAVGDGSIYIANYGASPATGAGRHGELVSIPA